MSRVLQAFEKYPLRAWSVIALLGTKIVANCNYIVSSCDTSGLRGVLPDQLDVFNHSGNVTASVGGAVIVAAASSALVSKTMRSNDNVERHRNRAALALGTLAAVAINATIESVGSFTPDPIDMAYGIGAGILAASMARIETPAVASK